MVRSTFDEIKRFGRSGVRCAAAVAVVLATAVVATPTTASADAGKAYDVWNLTGADVTLVGFDSPPPPGTYEQTKGLPALNTVLPYGQPMHFNLDRGNAVKPVFNNYRGIWKLEIALPSISKDGSIKCYPGGASACRPVSPGSGFNVMVLLDGPHTDVVIPPGDAQKQATMLNQLCANTDGETLGLKCNYSKMTRTETSTQWKLPPKFEAQTNQSKTEKSELDYTVSDTVTESTTYTLTAATSAKLLGVINTGITAELKKEATQSHTFSQTTKLRIPPKATGYICTSLPTWHYVGLLTASIGQTTWTMDGVSADLPNPDGVGHIETWDTDTYLPGDPCAGFVRGTIKGNQSSNK